MELATELGETAQYVTPAVSMLGTALVTLGDAGFDKADDTQYFE
ncbi:hypothetical protein ACFYXM_10645 [Streptomyces sp. NPDC002476]